jgi:type IV pilus assembly protein PilM
MANQAIGIDIGSHAIKIAVLERKGEAAKAVRLFRATIAGDTDPARLQGALQRAGIASGRGLLGISGRDLIIRYTHVPPVPDWRLKLLMQFEINEVSGQSGGQVAADYRRLKLPVESDEETVLVALARNTWLQPRLQAARGAGFRVGGGCPNSVAIFNAFLAHGSRKEGQTNFLVSIGRENIDMAIERDGELLFARNMSGGGHMFTEAIMNAFGLNETKAEKNKVTKGDLTPRAKARYADSTAEKLANTMQGPAGQLVSMIQSSVMICRAQTKIADLNVDRLVLTGGTARMKGLVDYFQANMSVPVDLFDPAKELDLSALPAGDQEELGDNAADFAAAIGLAESMLLPNAFRLEVLTETEKRRRHFLSRTIWAAGAAAAALALVVLLFKTRADDIAAVNAANDQLRDVAEHNKKILDDQKDTVTKELDARQKEVALRVRRLPGAVVRAVLDALLKTHRSEYIVLERFELESEKASFDLEGKRTESRASGGTSEEAKNNIHDQFLWPAIFVQGVLKQDTPDVGSEILAYYTELKRTLQGVQVEGWKIDVSTTMPDKNRHFEMRLAPVAPKPAEGN